MFDCAILLIILNYPHISQASVKYHLYWDTARLSGRPVSPNNVRFHWEKRPRILTPSQWPHQQCRTDQISSLRQHGFHSQGQLSGFPLLAYLWTRRLQEQDLSNSCYISINLIIKPRTW